MASERVAPTIAHRARRLWVVALLAAAPVLAAALVRAADKAKLTSEWADTSVAVDGVNTEWKALHTLAKDVRLSVAFRNDDRYLYIAMMTSDRTTAMQAIAQGLDVWVDVEGGTKKRFGLGYPVRGGLRPPGRERGGAEGGGENARRFPPDRGERGSGRPGEQAPDDEEAWKRLLSDPRFGQGEFLGKDKNDRRPISIAEQRSVLAKIGHSEGMLVYELAFALAKTDLTPDGLGVKPGAIVGVGVETPERSAGGPGGDGRGGMGGPPGGGPPGGGPPGGGMGGPPGGGMGGGPPGGGMGGRGGSMGGPRGGPGFVDQKQIKAWTTVQLARKPS